jgi:hypothetical protein
MHQYSIADDRYEGDKYNVEEDVENFPDNTARWVGDKVSHSLYIIHFSSSSSSFSRPTLPRYLAMFVTNWFCPCIRSGNLLFTERVNTRK